MNGSHSPEAPPAPLIAFEDFLAVVLDGGRPGGNLTKIFSVLGNSGQGSVDLIEISLGLFSGHLFPDN